MAVPQGERHWIETSLVPQKHHCDIIIFVTQTPCYYRDIQRNKLGPTLALPPLIEILI